MGEHLISFRGVLIVLSLAAGARGGELVVQLPASETVHVADAIERGSQVIQPGKPDANKATFANLQSGATYDLAIEDTSGHLLCGVDLSWCDPTPADPQAEALGDDDRAAIGAIVKDIKGFANKPSVVRLVGDHDRAVELVNLVRDNGFHSNAGDEVIWRAEVWFFRWENGGWERVANQSRVLRRERFATHAEYQKEIDRVVWTPELGGVRMANSPLMTIDISQPTTTASDSAAESHPTAPGVH